MDVMAGMAVIALCALIAFALYMLMRGEKSNNFDTDQPSAGKGIRTGRSPTILVPKFYIEQLSEDGKQTIERFPVCEIRDTGISISRPDATLGDIKLAQQQCAYTVSELHALIGWDERGYFLQDNGSANHTYVQGKPDPVHEIDIEDNLVVYLGMQPLRFTFYKRYEVGDDRRTETPQFRPAVLRRKENH